MIGARGVSVGYGGKVVVDGIDLVARSGQVVGLIGPNGSGKTTLLRSLYGALTPKSGLITLDDEPISEIPPRAMARRLGVVAQEASTEIPLTVAEMVLLGRSPYRSAVEGYSAEDHRVAAEALRQVGVRELADRAFGTLSGGEKQRVLIARAIAQQTPHLLLDEPTNHLDIRFQHATLGLVRDLGVTTVVVLHDLNLAARYCDRLILLHRGRPVAVGSPDAVLTPEVLEPVYEVSVRRIVDDGSIQLLFSPHVDSPDGRAGPATSRPAARTPRDPATPSSPR